MTLTYYIAITILGWGIGSFLFKGANNNMHPIMVSIIATCIYVLAIPLYFISLDFNRSINTAGILYTIFGGMFMCAGSLAYFYALRSGEAGQITSITALYPSLTLVLSYFLNNESLTIKKIFGILFAIGSTALLL